MRSLTTTIVQCSLAIIMLVLGGILISKGNLNGIFGTPPTPIGENLYSGFTAEDVTEISLSSNDAKVNFSRSSGAWMMTSPVKDRMDPRWAKTLIDFTLSTRAADVIPNEKIDSTQAGLTNGMVSVRLGNKAGDPLAKYTLGRRTAWIASDTESGEAVPTVFMQPRDPNRKTHTYACTGDIRAIFKDGFRFFRDHQPFLFAPSQLQKIHIKSATSEFVLEGLGQTVPWRITKPQKLATETSAVKNLIEKGLFSLRALRVFDRTQVTLPTSGETNYLTIEIQSVGQDAPVTLDVYPPADDKATTVYATVSDRPNTVFELPLRPHEDIISLFELPLKNYNELRSQSLTSFKPAKLQAVNIITPNAAPVLISRPPRGAWRLHNDDNGSSPLNERTLYQFLKTVTESKVAGFLTDSAFLTDESKDLVTYGLNVPLLALQFVFQDDSVLLLKIGKTKEGITTAYLNHPDSIHTVFKLSDGILESLPLRKKQWKDTRLLAIAPIDFVGLERTLVNSPALTLHYNYIKESWQAEADGKEASANLNLARANKVLETLGDLRVNSWLEPDDQHALETLANPLMKISILSRSLNEFGEQGDLRKHVLEITPVSAEGQSEYFYGRLSGERDLFLLDRKTALLLALDLFKESN